MDTNKDYEITITVSVREKDHWYNSPKGEIDFTLIMSGNMLNELKSKSEFPVNVSFEQLVLSAIERFGIQLAEKEKTNEDNPK